MANIHVALAQINTLVGDVAGNTRRVLDCVASHGKHCDLIVFPELSLTGYPPEDLLLQPDMRRQVEEALALLRAEVRGTLVAVGHPEYGDALPYNACSVIGGGVTRAVCRKRELPNYGVFDDKRYFAAGTEAVVTDIGGLPVGFTICEDAWAEAPIAEAAAAGARLIVNVSASPYSIGKREEREDVFAGRARDNDVPILYLNLVGGQDEVVFDGYSFAVNKAGEVVNRMPGFRESVAIFKIANRLGCRGRIGGRVALESTRREAGGDGDEAPAEEAATLRDETREPDADVYRALTLGVRDYAAKNGFKGALVGLSGGVDSALALAIAVDALGASHVTAVLMPSRYTSSLSHKLAKEQVRRLGVKSHTISIEQPYQAFMGALKDVFSGLAPDVTEENIQARCRGVILMAISNKSGKLVLATGNKSEYATGYATLYGDMAGGFAPLKDVSKTQVYRLARYRNRQSDAAPIPEQVLTREPSAELAADQKDTDKLPPYPVLDAVLAGLIEQDRSVAELVAEGFEPDTVYRIVEMVKKNEYKRRQAPPGVKISRLAFGRERRYPISSGFTLERSSGSSEGNPKPIRAPTKIFRKQVLVRRRNKKEL